MAPAKPQHATGRDDAPVDIEDLNETLLEGDHIAARADGVDWNDVIVRNGRWSGATLAGFRATDVTFEGCDLAGFVLQEEVSLRRVAFLDCRMTGAVLAGAHLRDVWFRGCNLDDANLRMIDAQDVEFDACSFLAADLQQAKLTRTKVAASDLRRIDLSKATLSEVDLRTSRLEEIQGAESLRGATIDTPQVLSAARSFAVAMGVNVVDDDDRD